MGERAALNINVQYGRTVDYMRVSITDRCNLRCRYCMPEGIELVSMEEILTYEEIERICTAAAKTGIRKLKITGGEPLVRLGCAELIGRLKQIPGMEQVTLTTNGVLLKRTAAGSESCGTGCGEYQSGQSGPGELSEDHRTGSAAACA